MTGILDSACLGLTSKGGGAAIVPCAESHVWGVLYAITDDDKYRLDIAENEAYHPGFLDVVSSVDGSTRSALVYLPSDGALQPRTNPPDRDYLLRMLAAARGWSIEPLIQQLEGVLAGSADTS
jgi:AIG2-like family